MSVRVTVTLLHVTVTLLQHTRYMFHGQSFDCKALRGPRWALLPRPRVSRQFGAHPPGLGASPNLTFTFTYFCPHSHY